MSKKILKAITETQNKKIPSMTFTQLAKYLGVRFNYRGEIEVPWNDWDQWLINLNKAPLKTYQKNYEKFHYTKNDTPAETSRCRAM